MSNGNRTDGASRAVAERPEVDLVEVAKERNAALLDEIVARMPRTSVADMKEMARMVHLSGLNGFTEAQAFVILMICEAEGLHPIAAVRRYHVIKGKLAMRAEAVLAEMQKRGWKVSWITEADDHGRQAALFQHRELCPVGKAVSFTMDQAEVAEIAHGENWKHWAPAMMRSRVSTTACRMLDPGIIVGIYSEDEVNDMTVAQSAAIAEGQDRLRAALQAAKKGEPTDFAPAPAKQLTSRAALRGWLEWMAALGNENWRSACAAAEVEPGKPFTQYQVGNGIITGWIRDGTISEDDVYTGTARDKAKAGAVLDRQWEEDETRFKRAAIVYINNKMYETAKQYEGADIEFEELDPDVLAPEKDPTPDVRQEPDADAPSSPS